MNIDPRLNEEIFDDDNPLNPLGGPGQPNNPDNPLFPPDTPTLPDPDGPPIRLPPELPGNPNPWDPDGVPVDPPDPPRGTPGFIPPDDFPDGLPDNFPGPDTQERWWWRWISSWKKYYEDLIKLINERISELYKLKLKYEDQINDLRDSGVSNNDPRITRLQSAIDMILDQINFLSEQWADAKYQLDMILAELAEFWSTIKRGVPTTWRKIERTIKRWWERRRKSRKRPPFPPRRRGPPGSASVDEIWDSLFDEDFSGSMTYTGLQWAVMIEAMFLDGVVGGGGYTSGDQSEYIAFQNMIDGVYEFFTEFNDPNQTYSYDDFIAILDGWIADGEQYSDPTRPDEPQGLVGPQQGKDLNINVSSTPTTPTITPSADPMGGQGASPEGEFAKAFARYNKGMQGKGIR